MFLELAETKAETETSSLLTGLIISGYECRFVMTPNANLSYLSQTSLTDTNIKKRVNEKHCVSNEHAFLLFPPQKKIETLRAI